MKISLILLAFSILTMHNVYASSKDSLVYDLGKYKVYTSKDRYIIQNSAGKTLYSDLKYFGGAFQNWQVLDAQNNLFYLDAEMKRSDTNDVFIGLCGTVPHYELIVEEEEHDFVVKKDETFYDNGNQIPAEELFRISKSHVDQLYFINGDSEFNFDGNFGIGTSMRSNPDLVVYKKNGKYGIWQDETGILYDFVHFEDYNLKLVKDGKVGYYGFTEIKYHDIQPFIYNLARINTTDGKTGYVDLNGKEYF